ncbi:MAG: helix-turn-helix domain-containing protein [Roseburia sp.]
MVFSTTNVAKVIREKRIAKNMTQMQLADEMGVSYQAVSNWERGNSMPDISKLGELAELLDCSLEELLGKNERTRTIEKIMSDKESSQGNEPDGEDTVEGKEEISLEELAEVAPLLPPKRTEGIMADIISNLDTVDVDDLIGLAPFLSDEVLDQIVERVQLENGTDFDDLTGLAPFLSDRTLKRLVDQVISNDDGNLEDLVGLAPFLSKETLNEIVEKVIEEDGDFDELVGLAPFLSKETLHKVAKMVVEREGISALAPFAPFL